MLNRVLFRTGFGADNRKLEFGPLSQLFGDLPVRCLMPQLPLIPTDYRVQPRVEALRFVWGPGRGSFHESLWANCLVFPVCAHLAI